MHPARLFPAAALALLALSAPRLPAAALVLTLTDAAGAPVADAVVSLHPLDAPAPAAPAPPPEVVVTQQDSEFTPPVTAIRTGSVVRFPNADRIQHHVYSLSPAKRFDIPLHSGKDAPAETFDRPGVVSIGCNIHDWMRAYIVVLDTPWFALTPADGLARLDAPAGRYRLEIWHARLAKPLATDLSLADAAPLAESRVLTLRKDRRPPRAPAPGADGYR